MKTGHYLTKILKLGAEHALYREDGMWFHNLKQFPGVLFDKDGYAIFNTEEEYYSNPLLQIKKDLHVKGGIKSLKIYRHFTVLERNLIYGVDLHHEKDKSNNEESLRVSREIDIILRKKILVDKIKKMYNYTCQICGTRISIHNDKYYSEVHHIIPLGIPHNGSDSIDNMICVCPNDHVLLDFFAIPIETKYLKLYRHDISAVAVEYHNLRVVNKIDKDHSKFR